MFARFTRRAARKQYAKRWQAETVFSMLKWNYGSALRARSSGRREQELLLIVMTHNIAV
jgi:transposase